MLGIIRNPDTVQIESLGTDISLGNFIFQNFFTVGESADVSVTISLLAGLKSCDPEFRILFRLMGASFYHTLKLLYWPWALPHFFAGLRVGVTVATIGAVIGEWVGAQQGLGFLMIQSNARLQVDLVFAAILWLTAMGLGLWMLVGLLEKKIVRWNR